MVDGFRVHIQEVAHSYPGLVVELRPSVGLKVLRMDLPYNPGVVHMVQVHRNREVVRMVQLRRNREVVRQGVAVAVRHCVAAGQAGHIPAVAVELLVVQLQVPVAGLPLV